jgi:hypothetical protein
MGCGGNDSSELLTLAEFFLSPLAFRHFSARPCWLQLLCGSLSTRSSISSRAFAMQQHAVFKA